MDAQVETNTTPTAGHAGLPRSVILVGLAIAALIVIAVVVALARPSAPTTYPAGSPEAAFQGYYAAWENGDLEAAYSHLSPAVTADLSLAEYRRVDSEQAWQRSQDRRLVLTAVETTGDRAVLHVRLDQAISGGIGDQRYSEDRTVRLVRQAGTWMIDEPLVGIESAAGYGY